MKHLTNRFFGLLAALCTFLVFLTMGCGQSPAVGEWKGQASGGAMALAATMGGAKAAEADINLKADGTGFAKLSIAPEQPVTWTEKDGKVVLTLGSKSGKSGDVVGTLSEDKKSMSVDLGMGITLNLTKVTK